MANRETQPLMAAADGKRTEVAVLAGGCFWGVEEILRDVPGVLDTEVGYTGGWLENPTYEDTHHSKSGHAEAIRVTFDPAVLSYEDLLEKWFFKLHDPTTLNRQGYDVGTQYRSAIFPQTPEQKSAAELVRALRFGVKETKWTMLVMRNLCQIQRDTFHESSMPSWTLGNDW